MGQCIAQILQVVLGADVNSYGTCRSEVDQSPQGMVVRFDEHPPESWVLCGEIVVSVGVQGNHDPLGRCQGK